jgi:hypothetical protein
MKAVFKNGTEKTINSHAILSDTRIQISFAGVASYDSLRAEMVVAATQSIKIYETDTSFVAFENYTKIIDPASITTASDETLDVVFVFEKEDELAQLVHTNSDDIKALYAAVDFLLGV